ncbi:hypothetical protein LZ554_001978 [Drepanopeziza brunnea f. sp. 'monogermtubi']|nr:hypothetical protein LZ554_001978 [Drepanopeziza brunnea f. sp. 'monogermtubi']
MDLHLILGHLGIACYWAQLFEAGFESWEVLKDITEADMGSIGMKLGHRRKLQREIATSRGVPPNATLESSVSCCCCRLATRQSECDSAIRMVVQRSVQYAMMDSGLARTLATGSTSADMDGFPWGTDFVSHAIYYQVMDC